MFRFTYHSKYQNFLAIRLNYLTGKKTGMVLNEERFKPILITKGRKTGKTHRVMLLAVKYNERIYFSRHRPDGDWFQNAIVNPNVKIEYNGEVFSGQAKPVTDENLSMKISELKYPNEERAKEKRVTIEVTLDK